MSSPSGGDSHRREPEYTHPPRQYTARQASGSASPDAPLPAQDGRHHSSDNAWLFPSSSYPATSHTYQPRSQPTTPPSTTTAHPPAQPAAMIPTPTFYDPEHAVPQQTTDYQTWLEHNYSAQQQSFVPAFAAFPDPQNHQQPAPAQMQRPMQTQAQAPAPLTNQYHFVPLQPAQQQPPKDGSSYSTYFAAPANAAANTSSRPMASRFVHQTGMPPARGARNATGASASYSAHSQNASAPPSAVDYLAPEVFYMGTSADDTAQYEQQQSYGGSEHLTPTSYTHGTPDSQTHSVSPTWNDERQLPALSTSASASTARPGGKRQKGAKAGGAAKGRKRARKDGGAGEESEWEVDEEDVQQSQGRMDGLPQRLPGACTYCKKLKMKCDFPKHENVCKRCKAGGHHCVVEGRKPRSAPNKREYLLAQIRQKDVIIESLLKQLHNPYLATPLSIAAYRMATPLSDNHRQNVIAWLDRMQSSVRRTPGAGAGFTLPRETPADDESDGGSETAPEHESDEPPTSAHTLVDPEAETYPGLPDTAVPLGLLANLSISNSKQKGKSALADLARAEDPNDDDDNVGVANDTYFLPGPAQDLALRAMLIDKSSPPDILVHGLVSPEDVDKLFESCLCLCCRESMIIERSWPRLVEMYRGQL